MSGYPYELQALITVAHQMGSEHRLALPGLSSLSFKCSGTEPFGIREENLWINSRDSDLASIMEQEFTCLRVQPILEVLALSQDFDQQSLQNLLLTNRRMADGLAPHPSTLLHLANPLPVTLLGHSAALQSVASAPGSQGRFQQLFGSRVALVSYQPSELRLAKKCWEISHTKKDLDGIYLMNMGILIFGETPDECLQRMRETSEKAEIFIREEGWWGVRAEGNRMGPTQHVRLKLANLRRSLSDMAHVPLLMSCNPELELFTPSQNHSFEAVSDKSWPYPEMYQTLKPYAVVNPDFRDGQEALRASDRYDEPVSLAVLDGELGWCLAAKKATELRTKQIWMDHNLDVMRIAENLGGYQSPSETEAFHKEEIPKLRTYENDGLRIFEGEVALVTGGASGIGKACVASLLARGAAVVSLDLNPNVTGLFPDQPGFLGLVCDISDEEAVSEAFERLVRCFGGLDMLVLNAGIFPGSKPIAELSLPDFQQTLQINLNANLVIMREAYPLLRISPRYGRVVINASKNVLAPGAGAAAYSSSKAALTQLGRVAILEWSKDRIRVNMVHPDAVFDTGIWTEEVIQDRAAHYHMTVEEYKTRNLLRVEIASQDVAELIAEMLGPRFEKITGAQIAVDGGSDRVI